MHDDSIFDNEGFEIDPGWDGPDMDYDPRIDENSDPSEWGDDGREDEWLDGSYEE
jgi:hypothetical protein